MKKIFLSEPLLRGNEIKYLNDCIKTNWIATGKYVKLFEEGFANFCNVPYSTTTANGTSALDAAILALGIGEGDEIIVSDLSYVSSANAIAHTGAKPIFVDVDKETWTIDSKKIEEKITKKTKAIIVVHLFGHPADMDEINRIARKYKLFVIEDACQAHGSLYKNKKTGSLGSVGCFSFSGAKVITTGEGGMVVSKSKKIVDNVNNIKTNYTSKKHKFYHTKVGHNFKLTNLQAAVGLAQLEKINELVSIKVKNANLYTKYLKDLEKFIQLPIEKPWAKNTYWLYSIIVKTPNLRDKLMQFLNKQGIETRPFFVSFHKLPMYKTNEKFPVSTYLSQNGVCLPSAVTLRKKDIEFISSQIKKFFTANIK